MIKTYIRKKVMTLLRLIFLSAVVVLMLSCGDDNPLNTGAGTGTVTIESVTENVQAAKIVVLKPTTSAEISFYDSKNTLLVKKALIVSGSRITGNVTVKAGSGYSAELFCFDAVNAITFSATSTDITITAGKVTTVTLLLEPALPEAPPLSSPVSSVLSDSTYVLSWSEVSRAQSYTIEEDTNSTFSNPVSKTITGTSESFTKTTDTAQTFHYRIRTNNASGSSGWSNVVSVTVEPDPLTEITMVSIPAGSFQMGSDDGLSDEQPIHTVVLDAFEMSSYEINQGQYKSVTGGSNPSDFKENDGLPVEQVSWYDAVTFCNRLSEQEGFEMCYDESTWACDFSRNGYRLPTEAEWEYACRAGTEAKFYTGNAISSDRFTSTDLDRAGWYDGNSEEKTHTAGQKESNEFGLYDMHGNVWEWCNDWFAEDYFSGSPSINPTGPASGSYRVFRGGSWYDFAWYCRSAGRAKTSPTSWFWNIGFRVVRGAFTPGAATLTLSMAVNQSGRGVTTPAAGIHTYDEDTVVNISAMPAEGYSFVDWTGTVEDAYSAATTVVMSSDKTVTANFEKIQVPITEITLVSISAGSFDMGDIQGGGDSDERPVREITLDGFEMSIYEITQGIYKFVTGSNPSGFTGDDNLPVEQVSWYEAVRFCNSMSDKAGFDRCYDENTWVCDFSKNGFRLPTEAEWEYACRAGTTTKYNTGDSESDLLNAGWYSENSGSKTHTVGRKEPNALGLYDMHGNVYEWCHDWYDKDYYQESPADNPTGAQTGSSCVIRGGDWYSGAGSCRSANRTFKLPDGRDKGIGFRVVRSAGG